VWSGCIKGRENDTCCFIITPWGSLFQGKSRTEWPGVSIMCLGDVIMLICGIVLQYARRSKVSVSISHIQFGHACTVVCNWTIADKLRYAHSLTAIEFSRCGGCLQSIRNLHITNSKIHKFMFCNDLMKALIQKQQHKPTYRDTHVNNPIHCTSIMWKCK